MDYSNGYRMGDGTKADVRGLLLENDVKSVVVRGHGWATTIMVDRKTGVFIKQITTYGAET